MSSTLAPVIERAESGSLVVTSETIAEGTGIEHRAVLQTLTKYSEDFESFGQVAFEMRAGYNNAQVRIALLNEQQASLLMTYQRNTEQVRRFKIALIDAFYKMAQQLQTPAPSELSRMEILQLAIKAEQENQALKAEVQAAVPKVAYVDQFVADTDLLKFRAVAARLNITETALRTLLLDKKWIYKETSSRWSEARQAKVEVSRYSAYADKRPYFQPCMNHEAPRFKGETMHTLKVTPTGASAIARLINHAQSFTALNGTGA